MAAPLPAAIVAVLVAVAPLLLARVGAALGNELAPSVASSGVGAALVLGPCLAAAAAGGVLAASLPTRALLGQQIGAGPFSDRSAVVAPLLLPAILATLVVVPSLGALTASLAGPFPGGRIAGLALGVAILAAVVAGAIAAEGIEIAMRGRRRGLLGIGIGLGAWMAVGEAIGNAPLGPLAAVGLALEGTVSSWVAFGIASVVALSLGSVWVGLASRRPERRPRSVPRRHLEVVWRLPAPAAASSLVARRLDVRHATIGALGFGSVGALVAVVGGAPSPGPFLLATTTTLLGSLVAALATFGILASGSWIWLGAPRSLRSIAAVAWLVGLSAAAIPVGAIAAVAAIISGVDGHTAGVVTVLVVTGAAVATIAGSLVPWRGEGVGDQLSSVGACIAVALALSLVIGLIAPRLTTVGLPDPGIAAALCVLLSALANTVVVQRLRAGAR